jgi:hypothetical protein
MSELLQPRLAARAAASQHIFPLKQQLLDVSQETDLASETAADYTVQRYDHVVLQPHEESTRATSSSQFDKPKALSSQRIRSKLVALEQQEFALPRHELEAIAQVERSRAAAVSATPCHE